MLNMLARSPFGEVPMKNLVTRKLHGSYLSAEFIVRDLIGQDKLRVMSTAVSHVGD